MTPTNSLRLALEKCQEWNRLHGNWSTYMEEFVGAALATQATSAPADVLGEVDAITRAFSLHCGIWPEDLQKFVQARVAAIRALTAPAAPQARCQERHPEGPQCELKLVGHGKIHLAGEYCWPVVAAPTSASLPAHHKCVECGLQIPCAISPNTERKCSFWKGLFAPSEPQAEQAAAHIGWIKGHWHCPDCEAEGTAGVSQSAPSAGPVSPTPPIQERFVSREEFNDSIADEAAQSCVDWSDPERRKEALRYIFRQIWNEAIAERHVSPSKFVTGMKCPTCESPAPHLHPALAFEGEVATCKDAFHSIATNQNPGPVSPSIAAPARAELQGIVARGYCHEKNAHKELDGDLLEAIVAELEAALAPSAAEKEKS
jgi:hypothetical protein